MVLKELIFQQFLLLEGVVVLKEVILTVPTLGGSNGLERTDFSIASPFGGSDGLERTDF